MKIRHIDYCEICQDEATSYYLFEGSDQDIWVCEDCYFKGKQQLEASI